MKKINQFHESLELILAHSHPLESEQIPFQEALGRILAEDVIASRNDPPAAKSAMDGYCLRANDTRSARPESPVELPFSGVLAAGHPFPEKLVPGSALKIMTGSLMPEGADAVVKQEDVREMERGSIALEGPLQCGENVLLKASHQRQGERVLRKGSPVTPQVLGMLAKLGKVELKAYRRPHVALLAIGDELVEPGMPLRMEQSYVSNLYSLYAAVKRCGGIPHRLGIARDDPGQIARMLRPSLDDTQSFAGSSPQRIIVTLGGSRRGTHDYAHAVLESLGTTIHFRETNINLAPSTIFATSGRRLFFALPGTPVPSWAAFELFLRPALWKMAGREHLQPALLQARLDSPLSTKRARRCFFPGWLTFKGSGPPCVSPLKIRRRDDLPSSLLANSLIHTPAEPQELEEGSMVTVEWTGAHSDWP